MHFQLKQFYLGEKQHLVTSKKELCELERNFPDVDYDEVNIEIILITQIISITFMLNDIGITTK